MALNYSRIEIYITEEAKYKGKPLSRALVDLVHEARIAARCMVFKGVEASYETGEVAAKEVLVLSFNMPVKVEIILPEAELDQVLPSIERMVEDGIVSVTDFPVRFHKTWRRMVPRHIRVKDVMTAQVASVYGETTADRVAERLMNAAYTSLPVINHDRRVLGVLTQGDLIYRAHMPLRLCWLAAADRADCRAVFESLSGHTAEEIMTRNPVTIEADKPLTDAVSLMLENKIKRLPVLDDAGKLAGMLSRLDIFKVIAREAPKWDAISRRQLPQVGNPCVVSDVMTRDVPSVRPDTSLEEAVDLLDVDVRTLPVLDDAGRLTGLISEGNFLEGLADKKENLIKLVAQKIHLRPRDIFASENLKGRRVAEVMMADVMSVAEDTGIDQAVKIMVDHQLKRLPVVDGEGRLVGMVSRDALLRLGIGDRD